jgi:hypothetical protein
VQGKVDPPVGIGRRPLRGHDTRRKARQDRTELAEPPGDQLHPVAAGQQEPFRGAEKPAAVRRSGLGAHVVVVEKERTAQNEVHPVVPPAQRSQEPIGDTGSEAETDLVDRADHCRGLVGTDHYRHRITTCVCLLRRPLDVPSVARD